ncbi:chemotaxis-specific protein-glutamate methyltransferase CheB [Lutispora sp.]|uniref:chemotaxis-specific protein-glutamate methyltransferase CheB n=1 Tax=Lutispora sp. TaxID=2828727 RepID=UPI002B21694F|nr:chemotaxis-specific protein-glutamate methyltransferase CheB [Lutispora sp.]MEA4961192.1 chemotaxis-specific protein-glutamate methyltransferase CheB [Lutispora sp.]
MRKISVIIVDDSALFRKFLNDAVERTNSAVVQASVADGMACLNELKQNKVDVVLLDVNMPGINGIDVLREIKEKYKDTQVIMISSAGNDNTALTVDALEMGALDFISKPRGSNPEANIFRISSYLKVLFNHIAINKFYSPVKKPANAEVVKPKTERQAPKSKIDLVLIASSTGGPKALYDVCGKLPSNLQLPVLIVQHMPVEFTAIFAKSLNNICKLEVAEAKEGDMPSGGKIYIAKGGKHMVLTKSASNGMTIKLIETPTVNGVRPAADVLFKSVAENFPDLNILVAVLTGMGKDGTDGLRELKKNGRCYVITQSEKTCAVYGMPKSVYEAGLSDEVLDIEDIAGGIIRRLSNQ